MKSQASLSRTKRGPKRGPNSNIDAEGVRKLLGWLLERPWWRPEPKHEGSANPVKNPTRVILESTKGPSKPAKATMHRSSLEQPGTAWSVLAWPPKLILMRMHSKLMQVWPGPPGLCFSASLSVNSIKIQSMLAWAFWALFLS